MQLRLPLVLASRSPRRRRLLKQLGLDFSVHPSAIDEVLPASLSPAAATEAVALEKAASVAAGYPEALTLAADTIVVLGEEVLEKPSSEDEAAHMLQRLSEKTHTVYTGLALLHPAGDARLTACEATRVTFDALTPEEIEAYVATGSPLDKAGAYGIQDDFGAVFVRRIEGDYYNVVGLPLNRLFRLLMTHFRDAVAL